MAKDVMLIKTSSLGDVIHALPVISDLRAVAAVDRIDWVVEASFATIPRLHSGVTNVIPVAIRNWRRGWRRHEVRDDITTCLRQLRGRSYDAIVDAQGLLKSAVVALAVRGTRYGFDFRSAREPISIFYHHTFRISWDLHAVERNRLLMARAVGYEVPLHCDYGIRSAAREFSWLPEKPYAVLLHATSGDYKLWPEQHWIALAAVLGSAGISCVLPWGSVVERERSARLASHMRSACVPPALSLADVPGLFAGSRLVVGVDTGLTHMAAALGVPTVGIYCATDPAATGLYGCARALNLGGPGLVPEWAQVMSAIEKLDI